jgi:Ca2+-binding RTX toxin-like protein
VTNRILLCLLALTACVDRSPPEAPATGSETIALLGPENIDPGDTGAQYAWSENAGWINAEPKPPAVESPGVYVTHGGLTGSMWLENLGWLSLSCENTGSCATSSYGVVNDGAGNLSGLAWGENIGWVDFLPSIAGIPVPGAGVVIDPSTGIFDGYAWGENIGWLSFTLGPATASSQIETSWRPCGSPTCDDTNACTIDTCEPTGCTYAPVNCDDGDSCTADSCDVGAGCVHTGLGCPAACSYDPARGIITVTMYGVEDTLSISAGNILLGATVCGTLGNTDTIVVNGSGELSIIGDFVPGRTAEPTGTSEIEFTINNDIILFDLAAGNDVVTIGPTGADLYADGDQDVVMSGAQSKVTYRGGAGNDTLDGTAATGPLYLYGGGGADQLIGGAAVDHLYGGGGNDIEKGGGGGDVFHEDAVANGADSLDGGPGPDTVDYEFRTAAVSVTLGDGIANDGEPGENDAPIAVERATGGLGADTLIGSSAANLLRGGRGDDILRGGGGVDTLYGDAGDDNLDGEAGADTMIGGAGNDTLVGDGAAIDTFTCQSGNDTVVGNTDGLAETVDCGAGADTAQGNAEDTFTSCENLTP